MTAPPYLNVGKRLLDVCLVLAAIPLALPLIIALSLVVRIKMGSPVFFRQVRPGFQGDPFLLIKFRTMNEAADDRGVSFSDSERITGLGNFLRSTSLDELPELLHVLKGEMSVVGPRPLLMKYLPLYTPQQMKRHNVLPGITGWAQINGRNALSWEEKFKLDLWYVENVSFWLDVKIILLSLWRVLLRDGIRQPGEATAKEFVGSGEPFTR